MTNSIYRPLWVLLLSILVVAGSYIAVARFPAEWGGPNIGGGLILLIGYIGVATGLVMLVIAWRRRAEDRP